MVDGGGELDPMVVESVNHCRIGSRLERLLQKRRLPELLDGEGEDYASLREEALPERHIGLFQT
jgi:hypothetical protein